MAPITVPMKVRIVLIELHVRATQRAISTLGCLVEGSFACSIVGHEIAQGPALGRGVLRMCVVVIEPGAVRQHEIALHFMERKRPKGVNLGELILFLILLKAGHAKATRILVRILPAIVPRLLERAGQMRTDQFHGFDDRINSLQIVPRNPVLGLNPK